MNFKLGKLIKRYDPRTLHMARYMPAIVTPPPFVDHASKLPTDIGMMLNDELGDCAIAGVGHMLQEWTLYAGDPILTLPNDEIRRVYGILSPNDWGCCLLDVLKYWKNTGIGGNKIDGFTEVGTGNLSNTEIAIECFGSCYIGVSLPDDYSEDGDWTEITSPSNPANGHCVVLLAYDRNKALFKVATWGSIRNMSYSWFQKYNDESYAVLDNIELIQAAGKTPEGFDWKTLQQDIRALR